jgi:hypothetical protein
MYISGYAIWRGGGHGGAIYDVGAMSTALFYLSHYDIHIYSTGALLSSSYDNFVKKKIRGIIGEGKTNRLIFLKSVYSINIENF